MNFEHPAFFTGTLGNGWECRTDEGVPTTYNLPKVHQHRKREETAREAVTVQEFPNACFLHASKAK